MKIEEFRKHAQSHNVIPVYRKLLADGETPLNIYKKLAQNKPGTFLLESAEHGGVWSRYSFIGVKSQTTLTEKDGQALWIGKPPVGVPTGVDPLTALRQSVAHLKSPKIDGLPTLTGGLVGYMGYDAVRRLEKLPKSAVRDIELPEISFMLTSDLVVMDHSDGTIILIANAINWDGSNERVDDSYLDAVSRLDRMQKELLGPIAGTRKRSDSIEEDVRLGEELLADPKERAEHLMLVDLGRNDLGRICAPGSVEVIDFMHIERYSHVMHIVSTVVGELASDKSPIDALFSVFPAGTLSGAPKPRAMEIIETLEPTRRALYGGAIGYFDFTGNIDTCIAIRTALIHNGTAYVQAGAGIVADSDPTAENDETLNKAAAVLVAIAAANEMKR